MMIIRTLLMGLLAFWSGSQAVASTAEAPEIFTSLRGLSGGMIEPGEPFFVSVRLEVPFESTHTIELTPRTGTWADGISFIIDGGPQKIAPVTAKPTFTAGEKTEAKLSADQALSGEWLIPASATSGFTPGHYELRVRFTLQGSSGWSGTVTSEPVVLRVVAVTNTDERVVQRAMALASEELATERLMEAAQRVDAVLTSRPDNIRLLGLRAKISARAGDLRGAMMCLNRALTSKEVKEAEHPPILLMELEEQLAEAMQTPDWAATPPPAWTKLPASVLAPRADTGSRKM